MNFLKNLIIIAVLAAVGYGVYISLSHNCESGQTSGGSAPGWPSLKVELPAAPSDSGSLKGASAQANSTLSPSAVGAGGANTMAPPFMSPPATAAQTNASGALAGVAMPTPPTVAPAVPYPSSVVPSVTLPSSPALAPSAAYPGSASSLTARGASVTPGEPITRGGILPASSFAATTAAPDSARTLARPEAAAIGGSAAPKADDVFLTKFRAFMSEVQKTLDQGKFAEALLALSSLHNDPNLPPLPADQKKRLDELLSQLAGTVIYSRRSLLEKPYMVQPGDTLDKIARQYRIPWQLLGRINGLLAPNGDVNDLESKDRPLPAGRELKVVRGPFDAVVNLSRHELTLMLDGRYAGRFPIGVGRDQPNLEGVYTVRNKTANPTYRGSDGVQYGPGDPRNPLGGAWIGLTDRIGIHGTSNPQAIGRDDNRGSICVSNPQVQDLFGILSVGSRVTIVR